MANGEDWKHDDEGDYPWFTSGGLFGGKLTEPQRAHIIARLKAATALGDATWDGVAVFNPAQACPACGYAKYHLLYVPDASHASEDCAKHAGSHAHMHQTCQRCKHVLVVRPLRESA